MMRSRRIGVLALWGCLMTLAIGCGDDENNDDRKDNPSSKSDAGMDSGDGRVEPADTDILIEGVDEILPIEDFDDGDIENELGGTWLTYDDGFDGADSVIWPTSIFNDGVFEASAPGYGGGLAAHITGTTGHVLAWDYLGFLTSLHPDALCPKAVSTEIDFSEYDGVQFMAKGSITKGAMVFKIPHKKDGEADNCTSNNVAADSLTAYCDYQVDFKKELTDTWSLIRIRFEELAQPDWGGAVALSAVLAHAKELVWQYEAQDGEIDFWLDNVALFKDLPDPNDVYPRPVVESTASLSLFDESTDPAKGTVTDISVSDQPFDTAKQVATDAEPEMLWDVSLSAANETPIKQDDVLHVEFSARCITPPEGKDTCRMGFLFQDGDAPYTQSISFPVAVGDTWTAFSYPFHVVKKYAPGEALAVLLLGYPAQTIAVGGFVITNYGDTETMDNLSKTDITYEGREADASWRTAAKERIETYRKGDLAVVVTDADGNPVEDAEVSVRMTRHHFGFGTAINAHDMRSELGETDLEKYEAAVPELFNTVVLENTLKWLSLSGEWGEEMGADLADWALDWSAEQGLDVRGHVLVWPGWNNLPAALKTGYDAELTDNGEAAAATWLRNEVNTHVRETAAAFAGRLLHWDVLNEPFDNHDLMDILGDDVMAEWFEIAKEADPEAKRFINDYSILNRKTTNSASRNHLIDVVTTLVDAEAPLDGIGFQAHFESDLTAPSELYDILEQFAVFDKALWVTEFDMDALDPELAADYTRDFLTVLFSHPLAGGFMMWGFWDGNHFGPSAPIYNKDWTEKESGKAYRELVFDTWWTDVNGKTDGEGTYATRAFFGDYTVTVTRDGTVHTEDVSFDPGSLSVEVTL